MKDGLFNLGAYGLPQGAAILFSGRITLAYAAHAADAIKDEQVRAELPGQIDIEPSDVVEITVIERRPVKAVVRWPFDDTQDLCLALNTPLFGEAFVRTVWFNSVSDKHHTLNKTVFSKP